MPLRRLFLSLSILSFLLLGIGFAWAAAGGSLFGPRDVAIGPYGVHLSAYRFEAGAARQGELVVTRRDPGGSLKGGLVLLNAQVINLGDLVAGGAASLTRTVALRATNLISVFLLGDPGVRLSLEVKGAIALPAPTAELTVSPASVVVGETVVLDWQSTHADELLIEPGVGPVGPSGSVTVSPKATTTFILTARGPGGSAEARATVNVTSPPAVSLSASPSVILKGEESTLSWSVAGAEAVHIEPAIGVVAPEGTKSIAPVHTTTYRLTATGPGGTASAEAVVQVYVDIAPQPPGSFGHVYQDLVPPDATVETYDARRFALITGLVRSLEGEPLAEVSVTIHGHPDFGTAVTDKDGRFSLPVEGGGVLTTVFRKAGYISAQRQVETPWNDMAVAETVVMVTEDPAATTIVFSGNPDQVHLHRSTPVSDEFGGRSCTVVFSGDNPPYLVDEKGNAVQPLTTITARATEFTTPESMPAKLPPNSAYTYCVELSVEGAARVKFGKPVVMWVENFLGFAVGGAVPVGYFDRDRGLWVPAENGRVVRLLDRDGDGVVDALDATGDGQADDLNANGLFEDEVAGLDNSQHHPPGLSFWRVEVSHFTPWDCNWPYGPPLDAGPPNAAGPPALDQQEPEEKTCSEEVGSFVEHRSRIFHEDIPIPGTGMSLHYASNRVAGYRHLITVPASGPTVPPSLKQISVKMEIAGCSCEAVLDPLPSQKAEFWWDGRDHLGREVSGSITAQVNIGFVYPAVYLSPGNFSRAFAQAGGSVTGIRARQEVISWRRHDLVVRSTGATGTIAEGWTLSHHHQINLVDLDTIHRGDGFSAIAGQQILSTVAGTGIAGHGGDGGPATEAHINYPNYISAHPSGDLYVTEDNIIRRIDRNGIINRVAGGGFCRGDGVPATTTCLDKPGRVVFDNSDNMFFIEWGAAGRVRKIDKEGIITTYAEGFSYPGNVAIDPSGNIYITVKAGDFSREILKIDTSKTISPVSIPPIANQRRVAPHDLASDNWGNLYFANNEGCTVGKIDNSGRYKTVAGVGWCADWDDGFYRGEGGPANQALLNFLSFIHVDQKGNLYFTTSHYDISRVLKVDSSGIITTVAGNGISGIGANAAPATLTPLAYPLGVSVGPDGSLYIAEAGANRIRKISGPNSLQALLMDGQIPFAEENGRGHIFSSDGRHLRTVELETGVALSSFDYDADGWLIAATDRFGNRTLIERDGGGRTVGIVSPDGLRTSLAVDGRNHLIQIRYPDGASYLFDYTAEGLLTFKKDPKGNRFDHVYDDAGRLEYSADEEQGLWQFGREVGIAGNAMSNLFSAEGQATFYQDRTESTGAYSSRITDAQGEEILFSSSADGLSARKTLPCGTSFDFLYGADTQFLYRTLNKAAETTPAGLKRETLFDKIYQDTDGDRRPDRITETVKVNGRTSSRVNDTLPGSTVITTPLERTTVLSYDPGNLLVSRTSRAELYDTQFGYDARGRLASTSTADRQTVLSYDAGGNLAAVTDPTGRRTSYEHDAVGRLTAVQRPDGSVVSFGYDANGNVTLLVNPAEVPHEFGFNRVNLKSSYRAPVSGSYQYRYDRDRRPLETLFPSGRLIRHSYDRGLLARTTTPEGEIDFGYLCGGKIGAISARGEGLSYTYDGSLLISESSSGSLSQTLAYSYNSDFQPVAAVYAGASTGYGYDADGQLINAGGYTIARHAGNGLPLQVSGQGLSVSRVFNGYGELAGQSVSVGGSATASFSLDRDRSGRIVYRSEAFGGAAAVYDYLYDANGRLTKVLKEGLPVEEYAYDEAGTRIFERNSLRGIEGRSYVYSDEDHLLKAGEWAYRYDADGFLTSKTNQTNSTNRTQYVYSSRGELLTVLLPEGRRIDYVHDPLGRRIAKRVDGAVLEKYLWQGMTRLLAVYSGTGALLMRFEYADDRLPVAMTAGGYRYFLAYDQVGSLRLVVNSSGNVVKSIQYDSFGNILEDTNPAFALPFGFAGGLHDRDTGLVRFGYRDYDPDVGRWTAKDPIGFAGGDTDLYGYVLNDPILKFDPEGKFGIAGATVGGAVGSAFGAFGAYSAGGSASQIMAAAAAGFLGGFVGGG